MKLSGPVIQRLDGGVDVTHYGYLYGPIFEHSEDRFYSWAEIQQYIADNPDQVTQQEAPAAPSLDSTKSRLCAETEDRLTSLLYSGFSFNGQRFPADLQAQTAAIDAEQDFGETGDISYLGAFCKANTWISMDAVTFKQFRTTGRAFVRGLFARVWKLKHVQISGATTNEEAQAFYDAWVAETIQ